MRRPDLMSLAEEERTDLLHLLRDLAPEQWTAPSLCTGWSVRDVAVHVVSYEELSPAATALTFLRGGLRAAKVNQVALRRYDGMGPADIIDLLGSHRRPRGVTSGFRGGIALTDATIHHQDIRRPLGMPRRIPEHRLLPVLDFAMGAPPLPSRSNRKDLRLAATDLDWSHGSGPEVSGPAEALLMAVAGRVHALDELSGEGLPILERRVVGRSEASDA